MPIKTFLTSEEINRMLDAADCVRDQLIISFYGDTGVRVSELLALTVDTVDLKSNEALIPHLKIGLRKKCPGCEKSAGRRQQFCSRCGYDISGVDAEGSETRTRVITFGDKTASLLKQYISGMKLKPSDRIINLSRQQIWLIVRQLAERSGLGGKAILNPDTGKSHYVHPHSFRDSLATAWLEYAGSDINKQVALQKALGHARFETTMRYNKLTPARVKEVSDEVRRSRFKT